DVIEATLGNLVETHERRQWFRYLDAPDDLAVLEDVLALARDERAQRLLARSDRSNDVYRRIEREQQRRQIADRRRRRQVAAERRTIYKGGRHKETAPHETHR